MTDLEIVLAVAFLIALTLASILGAHLSRSGRETRSDRAYIDLLDSIVSLQNLRRNEGLFPTMGPKNKERR